MVDRTLYEQFGGSEFFSALVADFYAGVAADDVLRPMYPEDDLGPAEDRLRMFLEQYWGGPKTYGEQRGHPRLRMRHQPFAVTPQPATAGWSTCAWRSTRAACRRIWIMRCGTTSTWPLRR